MPSDQEENRAVSQHTNIPEWPVPVAQVPSIVDILPADNKEFSDGEFSMDQFAADQLADEAINTDDLVTPDTESDLLQWSSPPPLVSKEALSTFWRQSIPFSVPLLSGLLVFVATLPVTLQALPTRPLSVLLMAIMLLVLMVIEGTLLYFAGSNDTLMALYVVGGSVLFIVAGVYIAFSFVAALLVFGGLLIIGLLLAKRSVHNTNLGHVDIVTSFGKYSQTLEPGLNLLLPWEHVVYSLNIQEDTWTTPRMEIPTSREQKVELAATISYQLMPEDAYLAATSVKDWEGSLKNLFRGTVQSVVNELTLADFVTWTQSIYTRSVNSDANSFNPASATRWDRINNTLARRMQDEVAAWGVQINWVRIEDLTPLPSVSGGNIPRLNGGNTTHIMKHEEVLAATPGAVQQLSKTETLPMPVEAASPKPAPAALPTTPKAQPAGKPPRVETLIDTYSAVREGKISDPALILALAEHFDTLANDRVANKTIDFDAGRAAATLRLRAQRLQEIASTE
ncbi:MAG TPA: SPFH domain-containing protein [Ktedonobacteraceae bacterium]